YLLQERTCPGPCPRCRCALIAERAAAPRHDGPDHWWIDCSTCGARESWETNAVRLCATPPPRLIPGEVAKIDVELIELHEHAPLTDARPLLVTHVKDTGRARIIYRSVTPIEKHKLTVEVPIPMDSAAEMHTFRFAVVHDLGIGYLRLRAPCMALRNRRED